MKKENTSKIINSYAEALYEAAEKQGESEKVFSDVSFLATELSDNKNTQYLANPLWANSEKAKVMTAFADQKGFSKPLKNTIQTIIENGRASLLAQTAKRFIDVYYKKKNISQVSVQTVIKMSDTQQKRLENSLEKHLGKKVVVNYKINPEILGGLLIECDSKLIDDSIKGKLDRIKLMMKGTK